MTSSYPCCIGVSFVATFLPRLTFLAVMIALVGEAFPAEPASQPTRDSVAISEYAPADGTFNGCTHIAFRDRLEVVTAGSRLYYREQPAALFQAGPSKFFDDAHSVAYNPRDKLFYVADSANHRLVAIGDPADGEASKIATTVAGVRLDRPHDIVCAAAAGWLYALNPNRVAVFRFKGLGQEESSLDLSKHLGYSRSLSLVKEKLYVVGSSAGKVVEVEDFEHGKFRVYNSFGKRRDAPAGSWKGSGLVPNDADFYGGFWYVTSYFCPTYAAGEDCNENKFIRFKTWDDFETGKWEDLSHLLPKDIVPYYLTPRDDGLYLAAFYHEGKGTPGKVYRITVRSK